VTCGGIVRAARARSSRIAPLDERIRQHEPQREILRLRRELVFEVAHPRESYRTCARSTAPAIPARPASCGVRHRYHVMHRVLLLVALGGCPARPSYLVTDVYSYDRPLQGALVAAHCATERGPAQRTDDAGRARLPVRLRTRAADCTLIVAKPGYATVELPAGHVCTNVAQCPAVEVELRETGR
jgi:hypothetical protein